MTLKYMQRIHSELLSKKLRLSKVLQSNAFLECEVQEPPSITTCNLVSICNGNTQVVHMIIIISVTLLALPETQS